MTGGFLCVSIMRPNHSWTFLHVSILAGLLLTLNAESVDSDCSPEINVRRDTKLEAFVGGNLRIKCPVTFCNNSPSTVSWHKLEKTFVPVNFNRSTHIKTEWKCSNLLEAISFLIFQNIQRNDSGQYNCQSGGSVSHSINVSVDDNRELPNDTVKNETNTTSHLNPSPPEDIWMYVYSAAGIVGFVIIVIIISVISMRGCKGKSKKETQNENQYMALPMVEQPFPPASLQPSPREGPSHPPSRRSTRKKTLPLQRNELPRDSVYGMIKEDEESQRNMAEEGSSVVYAALNHQLAPAAPARQWRQMEESSEYAAIRISH